MYNITMVLETLVTSPFSSWINLTWDLESSDGGERLTSCCHLCVEVNISCHQTCALNWRICRTAYRHTYTYETHVANPMAMYELCA